ncbi:MAG: CRISPR-associated protein Cas4 [Bacteroidota bacterium]|nr:CRISPR-associated protein Cas4 [Candidatus Kapabacteria bacterium]MDW8221020.1 CRISPR-associated protein Cas4 [Bacteroidota bacterium]
MSITPSDIIQYLYCPRFIFFERVLSIPQHEEQYSKVMRGRELHKQRLKQNAEYLRKRVGAVEKYQAQYLTNNLLRGEIDEVLVLADGTMSPLDYKFSTYNDIVYTTHKIQVFCYAWLIEENFGREVRRGFIVYTRSNNKLVEIPVQPEDKERVRSAAKAIRRITEGNVFPAATTCKKKCIECSYRNICVQ